MADRINRYGFVTPPAFNGLKLAVKCIVVGPTHIALLTEGNKVCRVAFTVLSDRLDLSKTEPNKKYVNSFATMYLKINDKYITSSTNKSHAANSNSAPSGSGSTGNTNRPGISRSRARIMRNSSAIRGGSSGSSGGGSGRIAPSGVIMSGGTSSSSRPIVSVPAPFVPEDLISQAQVVLQGKSRNLIIRELQV